MGRIPPYEDCELRHMVTNPLPPLSISVVLVTGAPKPEVDLACKTFERNFEYSYMSIPDYLQHLLDSRDAKDSTQALGLLHPTALRTELSRTGKVPTPFTIPILKYKINQEVDAGQRKFLIAGLGESMEAVMEFAARIAEPAALFSFKSADERFSDEQAAIEAHYEDVLLRIDGGSARDGDTLYKRLLAAIYKAGAQ